MKRYIILAFFICVEADEQIFIGAVNNKTTDGHYSYSSPQGYGNFYSTPQTVKDALVFTELTTDLFSLNAVQGANPSIYMQKGVGIASGDCGSPDIVPHYFMIWTDNPSASLSERQVVRYCVHPTAALGRRAYFGLMIQEDGSPALYSMNGNIEFLDKDLVVKNTNTETAEQEQPKKEHVAVPEEIEHGQEHGSSAAQEHKKIEEKKIEEKGVQA